jgi:hypothetical protein
MFRAVPPTPPPLAAQPLATQPLAIQPLATQPLATPPVAPLLGSQPLPVAMGRGFAPGSGHPRPRTAPTVPTRHPTADPTRIADPTLPPDAARTPDAARAVDVANARPVIADPAQIAAALAAIVSRVSAAPFGMAHTPSNAAPEGPPAVSGDSATDAATAGSTPIDEDSRATQPRMATQPAPFDASTTEPSIPALAIGDEGSLGRSPGAPGSAQGTPAQGAPARPWSSGLASRVEAALVDEWAHETPVVAPTSAELRALFGQPDVTRQLPVDEVEQLQRRAAELAEVDRQRRTAELAQAEPRRRTPPPTAEVDPEDIEAAIELAPPVRRPAAKNTIGVNRPKKPERPE